MNRRARVAAIATGVVVAIGVPAVLYSADVIGPKDDDKTTSTTRQAGVTDETDSGDGTASATKLPPHPSVLTGLELEEAARARPALVVKIDNAPKSRPQHGIGSADIVVEEGVEGGITRLAAIFHSQNPGLVGPVRSARSSDLHLAVPLSRPLFSYSGTNSNFQALIDRSPLIDVGVSKKPAAYHRKSGRPAPYNLFSNTHALFDAAPAGVTPPKKLVDVGGATAAAAGTPVKQLQVRWVDKVRTDVTWSWDGARSSRVQNGTPVVDANGPAVSPRNVVVLFVNYEDTGERDQSNSVVPEAKLIGTGEAWIVRDGTLIRGSWGKASQDAPIELADAARRAHRASSRTDLDRAAVARERIGCVVAAGAESSWSASR